MEKRFGVKLKTGGCGIAVQVETAGLEAPGVTNVDIADIQIPYQLYRTAGFVLPARLLQVRYRTVGNERYQGAVHGIIDHFRGSILLVIGPAKTHYQVVVIGELDNVVGK